MLTLQWSVGFWDKPSPEVDSVSAPFGFFSGYEKSVQSVCFAILLSVAELGKVLVAMSIFQVLFWGPISQSLQVQSGASFLGHFLPSGH